MAKMVKPLTVTQINNAKPTNKKSYLSDGGGLRLLIYPNGTKVWLFNYIKPYLGKRTEISLGAYPALSLQNARAKAAEYREYLAQSLDPQTVEEEKKIAERNKLNNTFAMVAREWLAYREKLGKERQDYSEKTKKDTEWRVADAIDVLGEIPFERITLRHGLEALEKHRAAGTLFELSKRHRVLKKIGEYAERFGYWQKMSGNI